MVVCMDPLGNFSNIEIRNYDAHSTLWECPRKSSLQCMGKAEDHEMRLRHAETIPHLEP